MKILVVDDEITSQGYLKKILAPYGTVDIATNGKEGISFFKESLGKNEYYDLICLDYHMPLMTGHETLTGIRKLEKKYGLTGAQRTKIIMITVTYDFDTIIDSFKLECEGYLTKPVRKEKLKELLQKVNII